MPNVSKSEILFLYESVYSIPNGDPFTAEQRYDDETKNILVSDVRIKRYIRDQIAATKPDSIFVLNEPTGSRPDKGGDPESGAAARARELAKGDMTLDAFTKLIDVRLFGGIVTAKKGAINLTGPVQFALLNPSLNRVDLRMHQNTSVFASSTEKSRGAIGTTTVVPYAVIQIHGWINPFSAAKTGLSEPDIQEMFQALWNGVNNANTRTKSNQNSLLLLQVVYSNDVAKVYGIDQTIRLKPSEGKREEQYRSGKDYSFDFSEFERQVLGSDKVSEVRYYTEAEHVAVAMEALKQNPKLRLMTLS